MGGPEIDHLIGLLSKLPGMGPRSARRAALKMLQQPESRMLPLAAALSEAARAVRPCADCGNLDSRDPCTICADPHRDRSIICVVEGVGDLWALERALVYRGLYHVLGGTLSALSGIGPDDLNVASLLSRVAEGQVSQTPLSAAAIPDRPMSEGSLPRGPLSRGPLSQGRVTEGAVSEVILALGATVDGATTAHYLADQLRATGVRITRVGQGVPIGGALDVLDDGTLAAALRGRRSA